jgi:hypothetical protein
MEVMLGRREHIETGVVGENGELAQLVQHLLVAFVVPPDRPQAFALLESRGNRREHEKHELHRSPPIIFG